ncbi:class I SAM-dependent methyltransferase [Rhodopseudomonas palustris]|nr:methyltransferase domain-containing protein [Rhodopseudomonas palustris]
MSVWRMWSDFLTGGAPAGPGGAELDARYGIETGASVELDQLTIRSDSRRFGEPYQASDPRVLADSLKYLGLDPRGRGFVDLGCGKGRMLIAAAELGFASCTGVEFAAELARAAQRNAAASGFRQIRIVHGDAGAYAFPDAPFVLYMFNPFSAEIMARVRDNLSRLRRPDYAIIYKNARERHLFDAMPALHHKGSPPRHGGLWATHLWVTQR